MRFIEAFETEEEAQAAAARLAVLSQIHGGEAAGIAAWRAERAAEAQAGAAEACAAWDGETGGQFWPEGPGRLPPIAAKVAGPVAVKAGRAAQLLRKPLFHDANELEAAAAEEAGHATVALALELEVLSACAAVPGKACCRIMPREDPLVGAAVAVAGLIARDRPAADQARRLGWGAVKSLLGDGADLRILRESFAMVGEGCNPEHGGYATKMLEDGFLLASSYLLLERDAFERIKDALLRNVTLDGDDLRALFAG